MIDNNALCEKIREIYPSIGQCGIDIDVNYDNGRNRWVVDLKYEDHHLKTYLEDGDAEFCLSGGQCIGLSIEINQLRDSVERMPSAHE